MLQAQQLPFSDYPLKDVRNFAAEGGHSLLWPEATTYLNNRGAYPRPETTTVAWLNPRQMATLLLLKHNCFRKKALPEGGQ